MTQEEKAKAYDRVSKEVKDFFEGRQKMYSDINQTLEYLFPELKESEDESRDEKIRKAIIEGLREMKSNFHTISSIKIDDAIAWLEKQGEQKKDILEDAILDGNEDGLIAETIRYKHEKQAEQKLDKVEPKFKVGDWIINLRTGLIKHVKNVLLCDNNGNYEFESSSMSIDSVDNSFRLWTIQDAKDGDILYINNTASESIMIYKSFNNGLIKKYASYNKFGFEGEHYLTLNDGYITPATKEQYTELFLKMHEAGYEWDSEKKELKKIEQNSTWSEEDEGIIEEVVSYLINYSNIVSKEDVDRIEYLINKIQDICPHQKQKWSDVDKDMLFRIIDDLKFLKDIISIDPKYAVNITDVEREITWLKSLRPQNKWKPSDEQMEALDWQVENTSVSSWQYKATKELMEDLKKLKG